MICALAATAQTEKSKAQLTAAVNAYLPDNNARQITPAILRQVLKDIFTSSYNKIDDAGLIDSTFFSEQVVSISDTMGSFQFNLLDTSTISFLVLDGNGSIKIGTSSNTDDVLMTQSFNSKTYISFCHKIVPPVLYLTSAGVVNVKLWFNNIITN